MAYPEKTTDHEQATGKLYHLRLRVECTLFCNLQSQARTHTHNCIGDRLEWVVRQSNYLTHWATGPLDSGYFAIKTGRHDIGKILLKVALNTITNIIKSNHLHLSAMFDSLSCQLTTCMIPILVDRFWIRYVCMWSHSNDYMYGSYTCRSVLDTVCLYVFTI
jgi:hypothetical protein